MGEPVNDETGKLGPPELPEWVDPLENDIFSEQNDILERAFPTQFQSWNKLWNTND